jgi:hypothetical protein
VGLWRLESVQNRGYNQHQLYAYRPIICGECAQKLQNELGSWLFKRLPKG